MSDKEVEETDSNETDEKEAENKTESSDNDNEDTSKALIEAEKFKKSLDKNFKNIKSEQEKTSKKAKSSSLRLSKKLNNSNEFTSRVESMQKQFSGTTLDKQQKYPDNPTLEKSYLVQLQTFYMCSLNDFREQSEQQAVQLKKNNEDQIKWLHPISSPKFEHKISEHFEAITEYISEWRRKGFCISLGAEGSLKKIFNVGASASGGREKETSHNTTKSGEGQNIYINILNIIPKIAFSLNDTQIELTDLAREKAKEVANNKISVEKFLKMFGTHFPLGQYEVGGIHSCVVHGSCENKIDTDELVNLCLIELKAKFHLGVAKIGSGALLGGGHSKSSKTNQTETSRRDVSIEHKIENTGPHEYDAIRFGQILKENENEWRIIKRPWGSNIVSIWEMIENDSDHEVKKAAKIVEDGYKK